MPGSVISIRVEDEMVERLDRLTSATDRSRSYIAAQAIREYIERNEWQVQAINEAVAKADEGQFISNEATNEWLQSWGAQNEKTAPLSDIKK